MGYLLALERHLHGYAYTILKCKISSKFYSFLFFARKRRNDKKGGYNLRSNRKGSVSSVDDTDSHSLPKSISISDPSNAPTSHQGGIVLKSVRPVPNDLQRIPSPVEFNAYVTNSQRKKYTQLPQVQQRPANIPRPIMEPHGTKPVAKFLEEVETCLPKRRGITRIEIHNPSEDLSCASSDPTTTLPRRRRFDSPAKAIVGDGKMTAPRESRTRPTDLQGRGVNDSRSGYRRDLNSKDNVSCLRGVVA